MQLLNIVLKGSVQAPFANMQTITNLEALVYKKCPFEYGFLAKTVAQLRDLLEI